MQLATAYPSFTNRLRSAPRTPFAEEVILYDPAGHGAVMLPAKDLSTRGVFVFCQVLFAEGQELICEFPLPDGSWVRAAGYVSRVCLDVEDPDRSGMGIEFTVISEHDRTRVDRIGRHLGTV